MVFFAPFALGLLATFLGWIGLGLVRSDAARGLLRASCVALCATPTIIGGHGIGVLPAWYLLRIEWLHPFALIAMAVVWVFALVVIFSVRRLRTSRTAWPLDIGRVLLEPTYPKLVFYGLLAMIGFAAGHELISHNPWLQVGVLIAGGAASYFLSRTAARRFGRTEWILPLAFAGPIGLTGLLVYTILWYAAGLAGLLVGIGHARRALWIGTATFGALFLLAALRIQEAVTARDMAHVTIQGGVTGAVTWAVIALLLTLACLLTMRRVGPTRREG